VNLLEDSSQLTCHDQLLEEKDLEIQEIIVDELGCSRKWAAMNVQDSVALLRSVAALTTSGVLSGICPIVADPHAHAVVVKEPLGVILGIAPWNAPLILGFRAVAAAVAAGNTAILKVNISRIGPLPWLSHSLTVCSGFRTQPTHSLFRRSTFPGRRLPSGRSQLPGSQARECRRDFRGIDLASCCA
jgi:hypothetical protein